MTSLVKFSQKRNLAQAKANQTAVGYYLVRTSDNTRHYISKTVDNYALERVYAQVMSDKDYDYWIDRLVGLDINGDRLWDNLDHTDRFF